MDARSDLYALGILVFTVLAGHEPYRGDTIAAVAVGHLQQPVPDLRSVRADVPTPWAEFVARLMAKDKDQRPAAATDVLAQLAQLPRTQAAAGKAAPA